jgi:photosystem II stability/assembly factor-like uncharacterized protein
MKKVLFFLVLFYTSFFFARGQQQYTTGEEILTSINNRISNKDTSIYTNYPVRNVGPVIQGGRITDIAVNEDDPKEFYIAFASGGVFKTTNNGITFLPVFDNQGALTVGDISLAPSNDQILWVGTGENNSSRSSYAGSGVYKSTDGGNTWKFMGLESTQHIGRIIVHPENPDIVWVAAAGNLYTHNPERGIFMTKDGGKTWAKTLFVNDSTGAIDLVINPENPDMLWATMWERTRKAWNFKGHGPGSAIYKSTNGGTNWEKAMTGIEDTEFAGRIGLDICLEKPNVVYALVDNQLETKSEKKRENGELIAADFVEMTEEQLLELDDDKLDDFLKNNSFPEKYNSEKVKEEVKGGKYKPRDIAEFLGDANNALFDTEVKGAEIYRSDDYGSTWKKTHDYQLDGVYFTYGYYFGEVRVAPSNPDRIYIFGVPLLRSDDGGKHFSRADTIGDVHSDHQAMWINPKDSEHLILGNDGGLYMSYDGGAAWNHINNIPAGQFYTVNFDMEKPYNIYGGLQDNGILFGSSRSIPNETKNWEFLFGGDGMFVIPDPRDFNLVYVGYQFGNYYRINTRTKERSYITPRPDIGESRLRFNWRTPVLMSTHNPDIIYLGANKLFRSMNKAEKWTAISDDLTKDLPNGNVPFSTITCISESTLKFGLLYVGTDDGNLHVSKDGGNSWDLISDNLPQNKWVTSIYPSTFEEGTVFVSLTGYRDDDFKAYVYKSENYGETWTAINGNLDIEAVNTVLQDLVVPNLLFVGTDHGTYISISDGEKWDLLPQVPNVASYDMAIHPRDHDLIIGTHGRSIYVLPLAPIRKIAESDNSSDFIVFKPGKVRFSKRWGEKRFPYLEAFTPEEKIMYFVTDKNEDVTFMVYREDIKYYEKSFKSKANGFNDFLWDLKVHPLKENKKPNTKELVFLEKGKYTLKFTYKDQSQEVALEVE